MWLPHSFVVFLLAASASGAIINTTVDDSSSQFSFVALGIPSRPHPHVPFVRSAVYIIGIDQALSQPDIAFTLGSISSVHHYTGTEQFVYNAVFFSATGLPSDQKQTDDPPPPPPSSSYVLLSKYIGLGTQVLSRTPQSLPNNVSCTSGCAGSSTASSTISSSSTGIKSSSASSTDSSESTPSSMTVTTNAAGEIITVTASARVSAQLRSTSNSNLGTIIGGVVGALACCVLIIVFLWLRLRRRMRRIEPETDKAARTQFLRLEDYPLHSTSTLPRTNAQEEGQSVPISLSTSGSKIRHRNNASVTGASNTTLSSPTEGHATTVTPSDPPRPIPDEPPAAAPANTPANSSAANLQVLEERVAMLEALTVNQHPPPAYVDEDDD
ncbi:hypothetical protein K438DRAFT_1805483 [Mycena galopus ATCC 62051]|nr:hypothetical protein K438DRAFT_1805483 [Mycena galopus ATCC 62051]